MLQLQLRSPLASLGVKKWEWYHLPSRCPSLSFSLLYAAIQLGICELPKLVWKGAAAEIELDAFWTLSLESGRDIFVIGLQERNY